MLFGCSGANRYPYSGTLQANSAAVGSTIGGRISAVLVADGRAVRAGDVLVRLDAAQQRAAVASAAGRVAQARATLADLEAGATREDLARAKALANQQRALFERSQATAPHQVAILRDQLRQARAQERDAAAAARDARLDAERLRKLYRSGDVSAQTRDAADAREDRAKAQLAAAHAGVRAARSQLANAQKATLPKETASAREGYRAAQESYRSLAAGTRPDQIRQARAALVAAQADLAAAKARLDEMIVVAPTGGVVSELNLHPGDLVAPGASVATIDERGDPYVRIYVPQSALGAFKVGGQLGVRSDASPRETFAGKIEQIDSQAQFTPQNVETAADRAVLSFGVKVRVHDPDGKLHGGTTVEVSAP
ncbi:MAG: HlyD family efflux transporter periplasmic adaptor subunit [Candidatus Eremiobacteraeota bacterium]|nr:HlyD family efflux transporter periplasmic adaptor subunit [Candidatus Eremiobacteraeota bacterium]